LALQKGGRDVVPVLDASLSQRRRKVELAELANEWWAMPPSESQPGSFFADTGGCGIGLRWRHIGLRPEHLCQQAVAHVRSSIVARQIEGNEPIASKTHARSGEGFYEPLTKRSSHQSRIEPRSEMRRLKTCQSYQPILRIAM
jgi:hypothetical protein